MHDRLVFALALAEFERRLGWPAIANCDVEEGLRFADEPSVISDQ